MGEGRSGAEGKPHGRSLVREILAILAFGALFSGVVLGLSLLGVPLPRRLLLLGALLGVGVPLGALALLWFGLGRVLEAATGGKVTPLRMAVATVVASALVVVACLVHQNLALAHEADDYTPLALLAVVVGLASVVTAFYSAELAARTRKSEDGRA